MLQPAHANLLEPRIQLPIDLIAKAYESSSCKHTMELLDHLTSVLAPLSRRIWWIGSCRLIRVSFEHRILEPPLGDFDIVFDIVHCPYLDCIA